MTSISKEELAPTHELKVWPEYFDALNRGEKSFEYRADDREPRYAAGQVLRLREYDPPYHYDAEGEYSGRECLRLVTYVARGGVIPEGFCVMSVVPVDCEHCGNPLAAHPIRFNDKLRCDPSDLSRLLEENEASEQREAALREELERVQGEEARLRSALENWGRHFEWCALRRSTAEQPVACDCGLDRESRAAKASFMTKEWCLAAARREISAVSEGRSVPATPAPSDSERTEKPFTHYCVECGPEFRFDSASSMHFDMYGHTPHKIVDRDDTPRELSND